jgi:hypothetical protein
MMTPKEQTQRVLLAIIAAVFAVVAIMPIAMHHAPHHREYVIRIALLPAAAAWLIIWKTPGSYALASFRTVMLAIALVGAGGLALHAFSALTSPWIKETVESARFAPQAIIYVALGVLGLIGSLLAGGDKRAESD